MHLSWPAARQASSEFTTLRRAHCASACQDGSKWAPSALPPDAGTGWLPEGLTPLHFLRDHMRAWIVNRRGVARLLCSSFREAAGLPRPHPDLDLRGGSRPVAGPATPTRASSSARSLCHWKAAPGSRGGALSKETVHKSLFRIWTRQDPQILSPLQSTARPLLGAGRPERRSAPPPPHPHPTRCFHLSVRWVLPSLPGAPRLVLAWGLVGGSLHDHTQG